MPRLKSYADTASACDAEAFVTHRRAFGAGEQADGRARAPVKSDIERRAIGGALVRLVRARFCVSKATLMVLSPSRCNPTPETSPVDFNMP